MTSVTEKMMLGFLEGYKRADEFDVVAGGGMSTSQEQTEWCGETAAQSQKTT